MAASVLAAEGMLSPIALWATATVGAWSGHVVWFIAGRLLDEGVLAHSDGLTARIRQAEALICRRPKTAIVLLQYLYGARVAGAVAFGLTDFSAYKFAAYELVNCAVWAAVVILVSYWIGEEAHTYLAGAGRWIWIGVSVGIVAWILHAARRAQQRPRLPAADRDPR